MKEQPPFRKGSGGSSRKDHTKPWKTPRQVENYWTFYKKDVYVSKRTSGLPGWLLPLLALILIVALVFWAAPLAVARWQAVHRQTDEPGLATQALRYGEQTRVVLEPVADVFSRPDLKADRITQVLYNEPVTLLPEGVLYGYAAVQLQDGVRGYMLSADLTVSRDSVEPAGFLYKAIVINAVKRVMSHARRGTLLVEVMMGTVLYVDYRGAGVSRVLLPDGASGWISDDGIVLLPSDSQIKQPYQPREAFCSTALTFLQATTLENGQSVRGISMAGIIRLSAAINGMDLPRTRQDLYMAGQAVTLQKSAETGLVELEDLQSGDLLVLADPHDLTEPADLAILIDAEQILYARPSQTAIRLMNLSQNEDIWRCIVAVRRLFP